LSKVAVRRLTESEYRHTIADVFGSEIEINARFEPEKRESGLLAIGSGLLTLSPSGVEQYFHLAVDISEQALSGAIRERIVGCKPQDPGKPDEACARQFITRYGELLLRRPLEAGETETRLRAAASGTEQSGDFYTGLKVALSSLLAAPEFLFRVETAEPDPRRPGQQRLDAYSKAARLSFLFWNTTPDEELLVAAKTGAIHTAEGLDEQISRLLASPRLVQGVRAFFADMLQLDSLDNLVKDPAIYPKFNRSVADGAREQMLRTVVGLLVEQERDYRELFTSNDTYMNRTLAAVYKVPFASADDWAPYTFGSSSQRSGIFSQIGFLSAFAHPGSSSPTRRGIKLYEIFLCDPTPDPPADVDFSRVKDGTDGTVRGRLLDHMENTGCAFCHRRTDPPGLALEHFDGLGQLRQYENGQLIDVSADVYGKKIEGASGLGQLLRDDPMVPACLVRNVFAYGVGRKADHRDETYLLEQTAAFAENGYRFPGLLRQVAASSGLFDVTIPGEASEDSVASQPSIPSVPTDSSLQSEEGAAVARAPRRP
jgi:hypothetical protein